MQVCSAIYVSYMDGGDFEDSKQLVNNLKT